MDEMPPSQLDEPINGLCVDKQAATPPCAECARFKLEVSENVEKAKYIMNYLDKTDIIINVKGQLEKERDQLKRLLEEKANYIEVKKKDEAELHCKLIKALEEKDDAYRLQKQINDLLKERNKALDEMHSVTGSKEQYKHFADKYRLENESLREKYEQLNRQYGEMINEMKHVESRMSNLKQNKDVKNLLSCLKKVVKIARRLRSDVRHTRPLSRKVNKDLSNIVETLKGLTVFELDISSESDEQEDDSFVIPGPSNLIVAAPKPRNRVSFTTQDTDHDDDDPTPPSKIRISAYHESEPVSFRTHPTPPVGVARPAKNYADPSKKRPGRKPATTAAPAKPPSSGSSQAAKKIQNEWIKAVAVAPPAFKKPAEAAVRTTAAKPAEPVVVVEAATTNKTYRAKLTNQDDDEIVAEEEVKLSWQEIKRKCRLLPLLSPIPDLIKANHQTCLTTKSAASVEKTLQDPNLSKPDILCETGQANNQLSTRDERRNSPNAISSDSEDDPVNLLIVDDNEAHIQVPVQKDSPDKPSANDEAATDQSAVDDPQGSGSFNLPPSSSDDEISGLDLVIDQEASHIDNSVTSPSSVPADEPPPIVTEHCSVESVKSTENAVDDVEMSTTAEKPAKSCGSRKRKSVVSDVAPDVGVEIPTNGGEKKSCLKKICKRTDEADLVAICCCSSIDEMKFPIRITQHLRSALDNLLKDERGAQPVTVFKMVAEKFDKLTPSVLVKCLLEVLPKCCCSLVGNVWKKSLVIKKMTGGSGHDWPSQAPYLSANDKKVFELLDLLFSSKYPWIQPTCNFLYEQLALKICKPTPGRIPITHQLFETYCRWLYVFCRKVTNFQFVGRFLTELALCGHKELHTTHHNKDLTAAFLCLASVWPDAFERCVFEQHEDTPNTSRADSYLLECFRDSLRKKYFSSNKDESILNKAKSLLLHFCPKPLSTAIDDLFATLLNSYSDTDNERALDKELKGLNPYLIGFADEPSVKLRTRDVNDDRDSENVNRWLEFSANFETCLFNLSKSAARCSEESVGRIVFEKLVVDCRPFLDADRETFLAQNGFSRLVVSLLTIGQLGRYCPNEKFTDICGLMENIHEKLNFGELTSNNDDETPLIEYVLYSSALHCAPYNAKLFEQLLRQLCILTTSSSHLKFLNRCYERFLKTFVDL